MANETKNEAQQRADADLAAVMGTVQGRAFVRRIIDACFLHGVNTELTERELLIREGRRDVAAKLVLEAQRVCPTLWVLSQREELDHAQKLAGVEE
jgi:hypothetical protein